MMSITRVKFKVIDAGVDGAELELKLKLMGTEWVRSSHFLRGCEDEVSFSTGVTIFYRFSRIQTVVQTRFCMRT